MYASNIRPGYSTEKSSLVRKVPTATKDKVEKVLKGLKRGKATGDNRVTVHFPKDGGAIVLGKLAKLFSGCLHA